MKRIALVLALWALSSAALSQTVTPAPGAAINDATTTLTSTWSSAQINNAVSSIAPSGPNSPTLNGLVSGGAVVNTTGLAFQNTVANYYINGALLSATSQTVTLTTADATNPRIDVVALDNTGTLIKITGTPAAQPSSPSVDPSTQLALTFVLVPALATAPPGVTNEAVYSAGTGWTGSTSGSGFNLSSSTNPTIGATSIEATALTSGSYANFDRGSGEVLTQAGGLLVFNIQSKAAWANKRTIQIQFRNASNVAVGPPVTLQTGAFGFTSSNTSSIQFVAIPIGNFALPAATSVRYVRFTDAGGAIGFWINPITIQTNTGSITPTGATGLTQAQGDARYLQSVAQTGPAALLTVSGSPVLASGVQAGTLALGLVSPTINTVFSGDATSTSGPVATFVSSGAYTTFNNVSSVATPYPASPVANDYALLYLSTLTNTGINPTGVPAGWTQVIATSGGPLTLAALYIKKLTGSESGTVTVSFTGGTGAGNGGSSFISYWHSVQQSGTVFEGAALLANSGTTASGSAVTTTGTNEKVITFYGAVKTTGTGSVTSGTPAGWTNDVFGSISSPVSTIGIADDITQTSPGTVGAPSRTLSASMFFSTISVALKPAPGPPGTPTFRALVNADLPAAATAQSQPSNPTAPASTSTFAMQGLAGSITPTRSGTVLVTISGTVVAPTGTTVNNGISYQISYGTGTAPVNAAALTGTQVGTVQTSTQAALVVAAADINVPFSTTAIVTGLTLGTPYWIDLAAKSVTTASQMGVANVSVSAVEP